MNPQALLYQNATTFLARGTPIAMCRLEWDAAKGKKHLAVPPPRDWQRQPLITAAAVTGRIRAGCNAYLYRLPDDVWVLDSDSAESVAWAAQFGPPVTITPRGEHRLYRGTSRIVLPDEQPETASDLAVRQLYGPGSFYDRAGVEVAYRGEPVDFATVPVMPAALMAPVPVLNLATPPVVDAAVQDQKARDFSPTAPAFDGFFAGAALNRTAAMQRAKAMLEAISFGATAGEQARSAIRDAALFLGGLLHTGWFDIDTARGQLQQACATRWGSADDSDAKWIEQGLSDGDQPRKRIAVRPDDPTAVMPGKDGSPAKGLRDRRYSPALLGKRPAPEFIVMGMIDTDGDV